MDTKLIMRLWDVIMRRSTQVSWCTKHNMVWRDCTCNYSAENHTIISTTQLWEIVMEVVQNE